MPVVGGKAHQGHQLSWATTLEKQYSIGHKKNVWLKRMCGLTSHRNWKGHLNTSQSWLVIAHSAKGKHATRNSVLTTCTQHSKQANTRYLSTPSFLSPCRGNHRPQFQEKHTSCVSQECLAASSTLELLLLGSNLRHKSKPLVFPRTHVSWSVLNSQSPLSTTSCTIVHTQARNHNPPQAIRKHLLPNYRPRWLHNDTERHCLSTWMNGLGDHCKTYLSFLKWTSFMGGGGWVNKAKMMTHTCAASIWQRTVFRHFAQQTQELLTTEIFIVPVEAWWHKRKSHRWPC